MSQDKMSLGHNVTGQNVTRTKCHMDKMSHGQNVIGQNVAGQNFTDKLLEKCHYVDSLFHPPLCLFYQAAFSI